MREKPKTTPKDFFLWLGAMVALYISATSFIILIHQYINILLPDELTRYVDPYSGAIRFSIASLIVMFPLFVWFLRILHKDIRLHPGKKELWVRRWLVFLTLFLGGLAMAIDIIWVIYSYLQGDLTLRFVLKAGTILLVVGAAFWYFMEELRGTWERKEKESITIGWVTSLVVLFAIAASFLILGSPETARLKKIDDQKVMDLQNIQWQIVSYWQQKEELPAALSQLEDPLMGYTLPVDPETGEEYVYRITTAPYSFELCADFNVAVEHGTAVGTLRPTTPASTHTGEENWNHGVGQTCFERTIDPERFPALKQVQAP